MNVIPVGQKTHRIDFLMPHYAHTEYHGKHNHRGTVAHRFFVQLSYARQSKQQTPMKELADLITYAEAYPIENHVYAHGHSRTHTDNYKVSIYAPLFRCKRIEQLLFELRHFLGIITARPHGQKQHVLFNVSQIQDYLAD